MISRWMLLGVGAALICTPVLGATQPTVNAYSPEDGKRAEDAVKAAGYQPEVISMAQGGNLFVNGTRDGKTYSLTVTPDGKVYPSTPS